MDIQRVKCTDCEHLILPETASATGGICGQCAKVSESLRRKRREFDQALAAGLVFGPSEEERNSVRRPSEFENVGHAWALEPEFYQDPETQSVRDVVANASEQPSGFVFLLSKPGARLSLSFNKRFGVCEYQDEESGDSWYAFSPKNLHEQVGKEDHLVQACPCCGVGMLWYPSRFHMPRNLAFAVLSAMALGSEGVTQDVEWLGCGDISYTSPGRG